MCLTCSGKEENNCLSCGDNLVLSDTFTCISVIYIYPYLESISNSEFRLVFPIDETNSKYVTAYVSSSLTDSEKSNEIIISGMTTSNYNHKIIQGDFNTNENSLSLTITYKID